MSLSPSDNNGTTHLVTPSTSSNYANYNVNQSVTITAPSSLTSGAQFAGWDYVCQSQSANNCTVTMDVERGIWALYTSTPALSLPTLISPGETINSTHTAIPYSSITFNWNKNNTGATYYLYVRDITGFADDVGTTSGTLVINGLNVGDVSSYAWTGAQASKKYRWEVDAVKSGSTVSSDRWVFVTQAGGTPTCTYTLGTSSASFSVSANSGSVNVTTTSACAWTAASNASWISVTSGASTTGSGGVGYSVAANTSTSSRTGTLTIAGQTFTVTQAGVNSHGAPVITSPGTASGTLNLSFSYPITATNNPTSYGWSGSLPPGLSINQSTGLISGTPTASGTFNVTVTATNGGGTGSTGSMTVAITIAPAGSAPGIGRTVIAAGYFHTCALTAAGGVKCWGDNGSGQLGDNTNTARSTAVDVSGLTAGVAAIAAGYGHTCALTTTGGVKCWGDNSSGQLGDTTTTAHFAPADVPGLTSGVAAIAAGGYHTCALTTAGGVKCWGHNNYHQAGGLAVNVDLTAPADVSGLTSGVATIAAGANHTCALTTAGGLKCWGQNLYGQLGYTTTSGTEIPVDVPGLTSGVAASTAGGRHTCALLTTTGGVKCWGDNSSGQLGDTTTTAHTAPADVSGLTSGAAAIAAGYRYYTCALTTAGGVKCWGDNSSYQLGDNTNINRAAPVDVLGFTSSVATFPLTVAPLGSGSGTITSSPVGINCGATCSGSFTSGTSVTLTATPTTGSSFAGWSSSGCSGTGSCAVAMNAAQTVTATFTLVPVSVSSCTLTPNPVSITAGSSSTLTANCSPAASSYVWTGGTCAGTAGASCTVTPALTTTYTAAGVNSGGTGAAAGATVTVTTTPGGIPASERAVLINLYNSTNGASWTNKTNWNGGVGTECTWYGVTCDGAQSHVTGIDMGSSPSPSTPPLGNNLVGTLPSLSGLTTLRSFSVASNHLSGSIPSLSGLTAFQFFYAAGNQLSGPIPSLSGLTALQFFHVGGNQLTGSIPSLSGLTALQGFYVHANQLSGSIPPLSGLTALQQFNVGGNTLTGSIPSLSGLTALNWFVVSVNQLTGPVPAAPSSLFAGQSSLCSNSLVSSGNLAIDAAWVTATGSTWLACQTAQILGFAQGWNLLGNSVSEAISVATVFGDAALVASVWKWDVTSSGWQFYTPSLTPTALQTYAASKGYGVLSVINPGEGYWVNAKLAGTLPTQTGSAFTLTSSKLTGGWNLVVTGSAVSPSVLNQSLSATPPSVGTVPINLTSLWAWDNPLSKWYFYAPSLEGQGSTALTDYVTSKGYLDFTASGKLLGAGTGFWVNKP